MTLHLFNPEHDIALATNVARFTAPHAGRQLHADLGFLPALWAADGDMVLVDDVEAALEAVRHVRRFAADVVFVSPKDVKSLPPSVSVAPWGWDQGVVEQLRLMGFPELVPPSAEQSPMGSRAPLASFAAGFPATHGRSSLRRQFRCLASRTALALCAQGSLEQQRTRRSLCTQPRPLAAQCCLGTQHHPEAGRHYA